MKAWINIFRNDLKNDVVFDTYCNREDATVSADGEMVTFFIVPCKQDETKDAIDRPERHSISGHMNDPSPTQEQAFKKDN